MSIREVYTGVSIVVHYTVPDHFVGAVHLEEKLVYMGDCWFTSILDES